LDTETHTAVSVVLAARNEERFIEPCVRSLLAQEPPPGGFEVIVAEGMSDDQTRRILDRLAAEDARLKVVANERQIAPAGWNAAIRAASGRYIAIMGAHARYPNDYLLRSFELAEKLHADNVGGPAIAEADTYLQRANAASHHSQFSVGGASWHDVDYEGKARTVFGGFYRRDVFDRIGMFDERFVRDSDAEFNFRLELAGGTIWQSPALGSWYRPRSTLGALFRQYMQYGYWKVRIMRKHGRAPAVRQYVPAVFVATNFVLVLASLTGRIVALWLLVTSLTLYAGALLVASVTTAARSGWDLLPILPVTFACYHVGYGIGFLAGLLDFVVLRRSQPRRSMVRLTR
jgi:succinoglycan biosynthesis protein ExoA